MQMAWGGHAIVERFVQPPAGIYLPVTLYQENVPFFLQVCPTICITNVDRKYCLIEVLRAALETSIHLSDANMNCWLDVFSDKELRAVTGLSPILLLCSYHVQGNMFATNTSLNP